MANGKVCTGYSKPWVARYSANAGVISYSGAMPLGRGVSVEVNPESADDNNFYADNQTAESAAGVFTGGTTTAVVDGLKEEAAALIFGWAATDEQGWDNEDDESVSPYVGFGFVVRYMEDGVTTYKPCVLVKGKFAKMSQSAETQEDQINWQTQSLSLAMMRGDDAKHTWRKFGHAEFATEEAAEDMIKQYLNYTAPTTEPTTEP